MISLPVSFARASSSILHRQSLHFRRSSPGLESCLAGEVIFRALSILRVSCLAGEVIFRALLFLVGIFGIGFKTVFVFFLKGPQKPTGVSVSVADASVQNHRIRIILTIVTAMSKINGFDISMYCFYRYI